MARRWTNEEEDYFRKELFDLYITQNKTIGEIGMLLGITYKGVFDRLQRLGIPTCRSEKAHFNNQRSDIRLPIERSESLAELFGMLLGDGHVNHFQIWVTLGTKELAYAYYAQSLIRLVFGGIPKMYIDKKRYKNIYLGSTLATAWLRREGLVNNKVVSQVDVPPWIFTKPQYMRGFLRGFFDTDGSIYALKFGVQISFTNYSKPILRSLQRMLKDLQYKPSEVSVHKVYVTHRKDVERFFREVRPKNQKHTRRYKKIMRRWRSSNRTWL